jgi:hypothetical protein
MAIYAKVTVVNWHGANVRAGCFDEQNGMFWEYSGSILSVVRRNSIQQLTGTVGINANTNLVIGSNSRFTQQAKVGEGDYGPGSYDGCENVFLPCCNYWCLEKHSTHHGI